LKHITSVSDIVQQDLPQVLKFSTAVNNGFMREGQLLEQEQIDKIRHIPAVIVQGRYDCVCPFKTAWDLHKG
jgi:hypothetical protein